MKVSRREEIIEILGERFSYMKAVSLSTRLPARQLAGGPAGQGVEGSENIDAKMFHFYTGTTLIQTL